MGAQVSKFMIWPILRKSRFESRSGKKFTVPATRSEGVEVFTYCLKL